MNRILAQSSPYGPLIAHSDSHSAGLSAQLDSHLLKSFLETLFRKSNDIKRLLNIVFRFHTGHCFCFIFQVVQQEALTRLLIEKGIFRKEEF
jgi:hypothetical protein